MRLRYLLSLVLLVVSAALPQLTQAQAAATSHDDEARALFEAGRVAYSDGRFDAALAHFRHSYELSGRPRLLYNIGSAADKLRRDQQALEAFEAYLAQVPDAENRNEVAARIEVLRAQVTAHATTAQPSTRVATPREAATPSTRENAGEATAVRVGDGRGQPRDDDGTILGEWWFWALIGAAVAGGVLIAVLAATSGDSTAELRTGTEGGVVFTLEMP